MSSKTKTTMNMMADALAPAKGASTKPVETTKPATTEAAKVPEATAPALTKEQLKAAADAAKAEAKAKKEAEKLAAKNKPIETCMELCKALWSSRGKVFLKVPEFPVPISIEKSSMTDFLKAHPNEPATYNLVPRADNTGSDLIPLKK